MQKMKGVIIPMITPFDENDNIDFKATDALIDYLIAGGVNGLYPCGTTGEMMKMTIEEKKRFTEHTIKYVNGRIPVFVQVGAANTKDTVELAKHAWKAGAAGIGVITPQFLRVTDEEMISYYKTVASSVPDDCSVYLYNIPQCSANDISVPVADFLASTMKNIVGIKYSYPDFNVFKEYVLCHDKEFDVICGPDQLFLPALSIGCKGVVAGCGNCDPVPFVKVYKAFESGDMEGAKTAQEQANDLAKIIKGCAILSYVKYGAHYNGIPLSHMRAPAMDIGEAEVKKMYAELDAYYFKYGKEL